MVAIVTGGGLGLENSSLSILGSAGQLGGASFGRGSEGVYVNAATGNLVLRRQDELLIGRGPDVGVLRSYNSLGALNDENADNWRLGFSRRVFGLSGTANTANSSVQRQDEEGNVTVYTYDAARTRYVNRSGGGSFNLLRFDDDDNTWVWQDGDSRDVEKYDNANGGRLIEVADKSGNRINLSYTGALLSSIVSRNAGLSDQETVFIDYYSAAGRTNNIRQIRTVTKGPAGAVTQVRTSYEYDASNRLHRVITDLTPDIGTDNSDATKRYLITYTYDDASNRVASLSQSDGSRLEFTYVLVAGGHRIQTVKDVRGADIRITHFAYDTVGLKTTVTDALSQVTELRYDAAGQLLGIKAPAVGGVAQEVSFTYDNSQSGLGNLLSSTDARGQTTIYEYDANGNRTLERDSSGNTIKRSYHSTKNMLLTETRYSAPDPDNGGSAQPSGAMTTRYVYDVSERLRYSISAEGRVTQYIYNSAGLLSNRILYTGNFYNLSGLGVATSPAEGTANTWVGTVNKQQAERTVYEYDFRGQLAAQTTYRELDSAGNGIALGAARTQYVYSQDGQLLQSIDARGLATPDIANDYTTVYTYDGLGRFLVVRDQAGVLSTNSYDEAGLKIVVTLRNGETTTTSFDAAGRPMSVSQSNGLNVLGTTTHAYDRLGRLRLSTDPTGVKRFYFFDEVGRQVGELEVQLDGKGALTEYCYNKNNQVISATRYANGVSASAINTALTQFGLGNFNSFTLAEAKGGYSLDAANDRTSYSVFNNAGQLAATVDAAGAVVIFSYDGTGRQVRIHRHATVLTTAHLTTLAATAATRELALTDLPLSIDNTNDRIERFFYDAEGLLVGKLDAGGYLCEYKYDAAGRPLESLHYAAATAAAARASGTLIALRPASDAANDQRTYSLYNARGQLEGLVDAESYLTEWTYDAVGNKASVTRYTDKVSYVAGATVDDLRPTSQTEDQITTYAYDYRNLITRQTSADGTVTSYEYDSIGRQIASTRAAGTLEARTNRIQYDRFGRVWKELSGIGSAALEALGAGATDAQKEAIWTQYATMHSYDSANRRTSSTDPLGNKTLFYYDAQGRLTHAINALGEVRTTTYSRLGDATDTRSYTKRLSTATLAGLTGGLVTSALTSAVTALNSTSDHVESATFTKRGEVAGRSDPLGADIKFAYNAFGELFHTDTKLQGSTRRIDLSTFDQRGQLKSLVEDQGSGKLNRSTSSKYDAFGRRIEYRDANGKLWQTGYDRLGRAVSATDPLNPARLTTYDAHGRVLTQTDALGYVTTFSYDTQARSVRVQTPESISATTVSNRHGAKQSITDARGNTTSYTYDADGQLKQVTEPPALAGEPQRITTSSYDKAGRLSETIDARGTKTSYAYDKAGRLFKRTVDPRNATNPNGLDLTTTYAYDGQGRTITMTDAAGTVTQNTFSARGQLLEVAVDPAGLNLRTGYSYDAAGRTLTVTEGKDSANPRVTQYIYNNLGWRSQEIIDPSGLNIVTRYHYDDAGNVRAKRNASGTDRESIERFIYDDLGRVRYAIDATGAVSFYQYDAEGRTTSTTRYAKLVSFLLPTDVGTVMTLDDLTARLMPSAAEDIVTRMVYDKDGRAIFAIDGTGALIERNYDGNGNVVKTVAYAARPGSLASYDLPSVRGAANALPAQNNRVTRAFYDAADRAAISVDAEGYVTRSSFNAVGREILRVRYAGRYVANDNHTLATFSAALPASVPSTAVTERFSHDAAGRLVDAIDGAGITTRYRYNEAGRVVDVVRAYGTNEASTTYKEYDAAGRLVGVTDPLGHSIRTEYDALGQAVKIIDQRGHAGYFYYDDAGRTVLHIDPEGYALETEYNALGMATLTRRYATRANGSYDTLQRPRLVSSAQDAITRFEHDKLGRQTTQTDAEGHVEAWTYDAFGNKRTHTNKLGGLFSYVYDKRGNVLSETLPVTSGGQAIKNTFEYDARGNLIKKTEAQGLPEARVMRFEYDALERQTAQVCEAVRVFDPLTQTVSNVDSIETRRYDFRGNLIELVDPVGARTLHYYDAADRKIASLSAVGGLSIFTYDAAGNLLSEYHHARPITLPAAAGGAVPSADALGDDRQIHYTYDAMGRQLTAGVPNVTALGPSGIYGAALVTTKVYDASGNIIQEIDARGNSVYHYYDKLGRRVAHVDQEKYLVTWDYAAGDQAIRETKYANKLSVLADETTSVQALKDNADSGWLDAVSGPGAAVIPYWYSDRGINPGTGAVFRGELTLGVSGIGRQLGLGIDNAQLATARRRHLAYIADNTLYVISNNGAGGVHEILSAVGSMKGDATYVVEVEFLANGTQLYVYEKGQGRAQGWTHFLTSSGWGPTYAYGFTGVAPGKPVVTDRFDNLSLVDAADTTLWSEDFNDSAPPAVTISANAGRQLATVDNDRIAEQLFDRMGRITETRVLNVASGAVDANGILTPAANTARTEYVYNGLGLVTTETLYTSATSTETTNKAYDLVGRIIREQKPTITDYQDVSVRPTVDFEYDGLNNVRRQIARGKDDVTESDDRIIRNVYGAGGRLLERWDASDAVTYFSYDKKGQAIRVRLDRADAHGTVHNDIVNIVYDAAGNEIQRSVLSKEQSDTVYGDPLETKETRFNVFGEVTGRRTNGGGAGAPWQEVIEYCNAGRAWRSTAGDGVTKIYLYDANGNTTHVITSSTVNLGLLTLPEIVALPADQLQVTMSRYDARNKLIATIEAPHGTGLPFAAPGALPVNAGRVGSTSFKVAASANFTTRSSGSHYVAQGGSESITFNLDTRAWGDGNVVITWSLDQVILSTLSKLRGFSQKVELSSADALAYTYSFLEEAVMDGSAGYSRSISTTAYNAARNLSNRVFRYNVVKKSAAGDIDLGSYVVNADVQSVITGASNLRDKTFESDVAPLKRLIFRDQPPSATRLVLQYRPANSGADWKLAHAAQAKNVTSNDIAGWFDLDLSDSAVWGLGNYEYNYVALDADDRILNSQTGILTVSDRASPTITQQARSIGGQGRIFMEAGGKVHFTEQGNQSTSLKLRYRRPDGAWSTAVEVPRFQIGGTTVNSWFVFDARAAGLFGTYEYIVEAYNTDQNLVNRVSGSFTFAITAGSPVAEPDLPETGQVGSSMLRVSATAGYITRKTGSYYYIDPGAGESIIFNLDTRAWGDGDVAITWSLDEVVLNDANKLRGVSPQLLNLTSLDALRYTHSFQEGFVGDSSARIGLSAYNTANALGSRTFRYSIVKKNAAGDINLGSYVVNAKVQSVIGGASNLNDKTFKGDVALVKRLVLRDQPPSATRLVLQYRPANSGADWKLAYATQQKNVVGGNIAGWFNVDMSDRAVWGEGNYEFNYVALDAESRVLNSASGTLSVSDTADPVIVQQARSIGGQGRIFMEAGSKLHITEQGYQSSALGLRYRKPEGVWSEWRYVPRFYIDGVPINGWFVFDPAQPDRDNSNAPGLPLGLYEFEFEAFEHGSHALVNSGKGTFVYDAASPVAEPDLPEIGNVGSSVLGVSATVEYITRNASGDYYLDPGAEETITFNLDTRAWGDGDVVITWSLDEVVLNAANKLRGVTPQLLNLTSLDALHHTHSFQEGFVRDSTLRIGLSAYTVAKELGSRTFRYSIVKKNAAGDINLGSYVLNTDILSVVTTDGPIRQRSFEAQAPVLRHLVLRDQPPSAARLILQYRPANSGADWKLAYATQQKNVGGGNIAGWFNVDMSDRAVWGEGNYEFSYVALDAESRVLNSASGTLSVSDTADPVIVQQARSIGGQGRIFMEAGGKLHITEQGYQSSALGLRYRKPEGVWSEWRYVPRFYIDGVAINGWFIFDPADPDRHNSIAPGLSSGQYEFEFETFEHGSHTLLNSGKGSFFYTSPGPLNLHDKPEVLHFYSESAAATRMVIEYRPLGSTQVFQSADVVRRGVGTFDWDAGAIVTHALADFDFEYRYKTYDASNVLLREAHGVLQLGARPLIKSYIVDSGAPTLDTPWIGSGVDTGPLSINRRQLYNAFGEVVQEIDGNGMVSDLRYNNLGHLVQKLDPETNATLTNGYQTRTRPVTGFVYDLAGRLIAVEDANGNVNLQTWLAGTGLQEEGKLLDGYHADGGTRKRGFDIFGDLRWEDDEIQRRTQYSYDENSRLLKVTRPSVPEVINEDEYRYDAAGNRIIHINAMEEDAKTFYDALGRITGTISAGDHLTGYEYDYRNDILGVSGSRVGGYEKTTTLPHGKSSIERSDVFGHLSWREDLGGHQYIYGYDHAGRMTTQTSTAGQNIAYAHYANGYIRSITDHTLGTVTAYEYDKEGNRTREFYNRRDGNNDWVSDQNAQIYYDEVNRMVRVLDSRADIRYEYDAAGNTRRVWSEYHDGVTGSKATQDYWYVYDSMNRFVITKGTLSGARATTASATDVQIIAGNTGVALSYNLAGERRYASYKLPDAANPGQYLSYTDEYRYGLNGQLEKTYINSVLRSERFSDLLGRVTTYWEWNATVTEKTYQRETTYDADSKMLTQEDWQRNENGSTKVHNETDFTYMNNGAGPLWKSEQLQHGIGGAENTTIESTYEYVWWDDAKQAEITADPHNQDFKWKDGWSKFTYDVNGHLLQVDDPSRGEANKGRSIRYVTNAEGLILSRIEIAGGTAHPSGVVYNGSVIEKHSFYYVNGHRVGDVGNDGKSLVTGSKSYAEDLTVYKKSVSLRKQYKRWKPVASADFDQSYQPINAQYPAHTPGDYTVNAGDTLQSVAATVWGDPAMWYLIADANGMSGAETLHAGQVLVIPNKVVNIHNNTDTFKVYNAGEAIGDTNPTLPEPKAKGDDGCGAIAMIIVMVVAVVVTAGALGVMAGATGGLGSTISLGLASLGAPGLVTIGGGLGATLGTFGSFALAGALGSIAGQAVGMALGVQDKFSWSSVAMSALSSGVSGQLGVSGPLAGRGFEQVVGRAIVGNAITQGVAVATGLQERFSWRSVAAAGMGSAAGFGVGKALEGVDVFGSKFANSVFSDTVSGIASGATQALVYGKKPNWGALAVQSFGQSLGNALVQDIALSAAQAAPMRSEFDGLYIDDPIPDDVWAVPRPEFQWDNDPIPEGVSAVPKYADYEYIDDFAIPDGVSAAGVTPSSQRRALGKWKAAEAPMEANRHTAKASKETTPPRSDESAWSSPLIHALNTSPSVQLPRVSGPLLQAANSQTVNLPFGLLEFVDPLLVPGFFVKTMREAITLDDKANAFYNNAGAQLIEHYEPELNTLIAREPGNYMYGSDAGDGFTANSFAKLYFPETEFWDNSGYKDSTYHRYDVLGMLGRVSTNRPIDYYVRGVQDNLSYPGEKMQPVENVLGGGTAMVYVALPAHSHLEDHTKYVIPIGLIEQAPVPGGHMNITTNWHGVYAGDIRISVFEHKGHAFMHIHGEGINRAFNMDDTFNTYPERYVGAKTNDWAGASAFRELFEQSYKFLSKPRSRLKE
jgi:YD repeat-containing protein